MGRLMPRWCFEMAQPVTPSEVRTWIKEFLRERPHIGLGSAMSVMIFEPRNLFDSSARRKPRAGFVLGVVLCVVSLGCFCYFNFAR